MIHPAASKGIIDSAELAAMISAGKPVKILDATFTLPNDAADAAALYAQKRLPGAQFFDFKKAVNPDTEIPNMLPVPEAFAAYMGERGISNGDFIVVYGQTGMVMGPARLWWMLRVFGHDNVAVLNGGLPAWMKEGFPLETSTTAPAAPGQFIARFRPELVRGIEQVKNALGDAEIKILDARPPERFSGQSPEPRPGMRSGHIPGSCNIYAGSLTDPATGKLKSRPELEKICESARFSLYDSTILSCGSGTTACMLALALFNMGKNDAPVYDGSWSEWGRESANTPISTSAK